MQHLFPEPRTRFDRPIRVPDDLATSLDGRAYFEAAKSNLVRLRDPLFNGQTIRDRSSLSCTLGIDNKSNVIALVNTYVQRIQTAFYRSLVPRDRDVNLPQ